MKSIIRTTVPTLAAAFLMLGWGNTGHRFINSRAVIHLPESMQAWKIESTFFADHGSDADYRKGGDPTEGPKHFIDLELYPDYMHLSDNLDSLKASVGESAVLSNGILPWATRVAYDSLVAQLDRDDWEKAKLTASDIGHYVGDGHQPLHNTANYNGQLSGNIGIHSRYETGMINAFEQQLLASQREAQYVDDVFAYCLAYSIAGNAYVDSIMIADDAAKAASGWNGSGTPPQSYYDALWAATKDLTMKQMQRATEALADLWYSAAVDAGTLSSTGAEGGHGTSPSMFGLYQNYPNPFNPTTVISFRSLGDTAARLTVHDLSGRTIQTLVDGPISAGDHRVPFDATHLTGGIYIYTLETSTSSMSRKMLLIR